MTSTIGLSKQVQQTAVELLSTLLANTYLLTLKTQNYHWNVTSTHFYSYHKMFEEQYDQLSDANDDIAERIRALGSTTPASFAAFLKLATIKEQNANSAADMINNLLADHEAVVVSLRAGIEKLADSHDEGTIDFFVERIREHEKTAWMLRSSV